MWYVMPGAPQHTELTGLTLKTEMGWAALSPWDISSSNLPSPSRSVTMAPAGVQEMQFTLEN